MDLSSRLRFYIERGRKMSGYETVFKSRLLLVALALLAGLASFIAFGGTAYGEGELPEGFATRRA